MGIKYRMAIKEAMKDEKGRVKQNLQEAWDLHKEGMHIVEIANMYGDTRTGEILYWIATEDDGV